MGSAAPETPPPAADGVPAKFALECQFSGVLGASVLARLVEESPSSF